MAAPEEVVTRGHCGRRTLCSGRGTRLDDVTIAAISGPGLISGPPLFTLTPIQAGLGLEAARGRMAPMSLEYGHSGSYEARI